MPPDQSEAERLERLSWIRFFANPESDFQITVNERFNLILLLAK